MARNTSSAAADTRVFYRDIKPYHAPDSLGELHGPRSGTIELPITVYWGPAPVVNLDLRDGTDEMAYRAILSEGLIDDQVELLNRDLLIELWPRLSLPRRVKDLWESRFPELAATV